MLLPVGASQNYMRLSTLPNTQQSRLLKYTAAPIRSLLSLSLVYLPLSLSLAVSPLNATIIFLVTLDKG